MKAGTPLVLALLSAAALEAQGVPGTVRIANGQQLSGKIAFGSAIFIQDQGITDASRTADTLYFRNDRDLIVAMPASKIRTIQIRYAAAGHGLLRREAQVRTNTVGLIKGSLPVWHEAPAGPSRLVFTRYVEIESPSGALMRIELPDRDDVPPGNRVVAIDFAGPGVPEAALQ